MKIVIIGNGVAGMTTARVLREKGNQSEIIIFTEEPFPYYPRPKLIEFLAGRVKQEELYFYPPTWYMERGIEISYSDPALSIDPISKTVTAKNEESFDFLILTVGSRANFPFPQSPPKGVFTLRTIQDALAIKEWAKGAKEALVIGGGLLGLESAHALLGLSLKVTVLEHNNRLLPRQLDPEGSRILQRLLESKGLNFLTSASVAEFLGKDSVSGVRLESGQTVPADLILISAGVHPEASLAKNCGILVNKGILVNDQMQTNYPYIYAAGDVAEWKGKIWGIIPPAIEEATVAAANIAGEETAFAGSVPSNTLKVIGIDLMTAGSSTGAEGFQEVRVEDEAAGKYFKIFLSQEKVMGAIALGSKKTGIVLNKLVRDGQQLSIQEAKKILENGLEKGEEQ